MPKISKHTCSVSKKRYLMPTSSNQVLPNVTILQACLIKHALIKNLMLDNQTGDSRWQKLRQYQTLNIKIYMSRFDNTKEMHSMYLLPFSNLCFRTIVLKMSIKHFEQLSAMKFATGHQKQWSFLVWCQHLEKFGKKWTNGLGYSIDQSLNMLTFTQVFKKHWQWNFPKRKVFTSHKLTNHYSLKRS